MAKEIVNLTKTVYNKNQYTKVIDTQFSQLVFTPSVENIAASIPSTEVQVNQFFNQYQNLFFDIPKLGEINSFFVFCSCSENDAIKKGILDKIMSFTIDDVRAIARSYCVLYSENKDVFSIIPKPY